MRRLPIRVRITLAFAGVMAVLLAGLGLFIYLRFETQLTNAVDQGLRSRAAEVSTLIGQSSGRPLAQGQTNVISERDEGFAQILTPSGRVLDSSAILGNRPVLSASDVERAAGGRLLAERQIPAVEGDVRLLAVPVQSDGRQLIVVVAASIDDRQDAASNLRKLLLIGGAVALLLASLAGYGAATAALRPVEAMRLRAGEITADGGERRLPLPPARDELHRLGETLNAMLGRLEAAIERERAFVDDASHELRTPLALHKTELELALRYGDDSAELKKAIAASIDEVDRLINLAEGLLVVARSEKGELALDLAPVDLPRLLDDTAERFSGRARQAGRELTVAANGAGTVEADRVRLEQALTNLVDNALRYGEGPVLLSARGEDGTVELSVTDAGPGFPAEFLPRAFERFSRADSGRSRGGSGLGLAIVDAIASAHRGTVHAQNRAGGGAEVVIRLPRQA